MLDLGLRAFRENSGCTEGLCKEVLRTTSEICKGVTTDCGTMGIRLLLGNKALLFVLLLSVPAGFLRPLLHLLTLALALVIPWCSLNVGPSLGLCWKQREENPKPKTLNNSLHCLFH